MQYHWISLHLSVQVNTLFMWYQSFSLGGKESLNKPLIKWELYETGSCHLFKLRWAKYLFLPHTDVLCLPVTTLWLKFNRLLTGDVSCTNQHIKSICFFLLLFHGNILFYLIFLYSNSLPSPLFISYFTPLPQIFCCTYKKLIPAEVSFPFFFNTMMSQES